MTFNKYYKEKDYVENLLNQRKFNNTIKSDLKLIAKYYKSLNKSNKEIEDEIKKLLKNKLVEFNEVLYYKIIDNAINFANKENNNLIQIESIPITKTEIEFIASLSYDDLEKKILFSFIVIDKLKQEKSRLNGYDENDKHYFGGSGSFSYKSLLDTLQEKITRTYKEKGIHKTIKKFNEDRLTRTTNLATIELLFINEIEADDEVVLNVTDFDTIGLYYDLHTGNKKVKWCECCGKKLIRITSSTKKLCKNCYILIRNEQNKQKSLKYYHRTKTLPNDNML